MDLSTGSLLLEEAAEERP
jgi:hypothetical protein